MAYVAVEGVFARESVCLKDDSPLGVTGVGWCNNGEGDGGRLGIKGGDGGMPFFSVPEFGVFAVFVFFLALNGLKNDHSDSNCTESNSDDTGELSSIAASSN